MIPKAPAPTVLAGSGGTQAPAQPTESSSNDQDGLDTLLLAYVAALDACDAVPFLSMRPLFSLYFNLFIWYFCTSMAPFCLTLDGLLVVQRRLFGGPRVVIGTAVYDTVTAPFLSIWNGEIPALCVFRIRRLTQWMVISQAKAGAGTLRSAIGLKQLQLGHAAAADPASPLQADQIALERFETIVGGWNTRSAVVVFTSLLSLAGLAAERLATLILPMLSKDLLATAANVAKWLHLPSSDGIDIDRPDAMLAWVTGGLFLLNYLVMILVSAWLDKRAIYRRFELEALTVRVFKPFGLTLRRELPLDLLGALTVFLVCLPLLLAIQEVIPAFTTEPSGVANANASGWIINGFALLVTSIMLIIALFRRIREDLEQRKEKLSENGLFFRG